MAVDSIARATHPIRYKPKLLHTWKLLQEYEGVCTGGVATNKIVMYIQVYNEIEHVALVSAIVVWLNSDTYKLLSMQHSSMVWYLSMEYRRQDLGTCKSHSQD